LKINEIRKKMKKITTTILTLLVFFSVELISQGINDIFTGGRVSGNFQIEAQTYSKDTLIGASDVP